MNYYEINVQKNMYPISKREHQVLELIAFEYTTKEIAQKLFISYDTANTHRKNLMHKMDAKNTAGLVRRAYEFGHLILSIRTVA